MKKIRVKFYSREEFFKFFDRFISETSKGKRTKKDGKKIRYDTIENYGYCKKLLQRFCEEKNFEFSKYVQRYTPHKSSESGFFVRIIAISLKISPSQASFVYTPLRHPSNSIL